MNVYARCRWPLAAVMTAGLGLSSATAAPTFRSAATALVQGGTSITVNTPPGVLPGDVMIAQINHEDQLQSITPPGGWNLIRRDDSKFLQALYYRVATAEPPSYAWSFSGTPHDITGVIAAFSGVEHTNPIDAHGGQANSSGMPTTAPSIVTTVPDTLLVALFGIENPVTFSPPPSMSERWDFGSPADMTAEGSDEIFAGPGPTGTRTATYAGPADDTIGQLIALTSGRSISGTVFEDVNYGGGPGRDRTTAAADAPTFAVGRSGVTVELYDAAGSFLGSSVTGAGGVYAFVGLAPGSYTVRTVNATVTSSRPGSDGSELGVQTYRSDGASEAPGSGAAKVGGERPSNEDAGANAGAQTLASLQGTDVDADGVPEWTQSIVTVNVSTGDATSVDFGFNFDTIVNTNAAGQGSLRQFILNSNLLG